jgi:hypothetical protein
MSVLQGGGMRQGAHPQQLWRHCAPWCPYWQLVKWHLGDCTCHSSHAAAPESSRPMLVATAGTLLTALLTLQNVTRQSCSCDPHPSLGAACRSVDATHIRQLEQCKQAHTAWAGTRHFWICVLRWRDPSCSLRLRRCVVRTGDKRRYTSRDDDGCGTDYVFVSLLCNGLIDTPGSAEPSCHRPRFKHQPPAAVPHSANNQPLHEDVCTGDSDYCALYTRRFAAKIVVVHRCMLQHWTHGLSGRPARRRRRVAAHQ